MALEAFSPVHVAIVASVPAAAGLLAGWARRNPRVIPAVRSALAAGIAANEVAWYAWVLSRGWVSPPAGLPLDLCDVVLWLTVYALVAPRQWALEVVYYLGLAGSGMALLTPEVVGPFPSYPGVKFLLSHGAVVGAVLFLAWIGELRPRPGSWWRVLLAVNAYAAVLALVNARFGTNYMYLREKPEAPSLLDLFGPWPWYVLGGEAVAFALLWLLGNPLRPGRRAGARGRGRARA